MMFRAAVPALLALVLAACSQTPGPTAAQRATGPAAAARASLARADFIPTAPGHVWQYEVVGHPSDDPFVDYPGVETVVVQKSAKKGSRTTVEMRALDDFTGRYRFPTLTWDEGGLYLGEVTYWGPMAATAERHHINLIEFPFALGKKWDDGQWVGEILKEETVSVPAGTFKTWKVSAIGTYDNEYTAVGDYWVAPGVGIVKSYLNTPNGIFESELIPAGKAPKAGQPKKPFPIKKK